MLDRNNGMSYYRQIAAIIEKRINDGYWKNGQQLPTEFDFSKAFNVNRHTVRKSLELLARRGLLVKEKGVGTFVCKRSEFPLEYILSRDNSFTGNIQSLGLIPVNRLLAMEDDLACGEIGKRLQLEIGSPVLRFSMIRQVDNDVMLLAHYCISLERLPGFNRYLQENCSLFDIYARHYEYVPSRSYTSFEAVSADDYTSLILKLPYDAPVLKLSSLLLDPDGVPVQYSDSYYRSDLIRLTIGWEGGGASTVEAGL